MPPPHPRLRARSVAVDVTGDLLARVPDEVDPREVVTWLREGDGMVGWGRAAVVRTTGQDRFTGAETWWDLVRRDAQVEDEVRLPGSGLVAFGSFAFSPGSSDDSVLTVPRTLIGRRDGLAWVTQVVVDDEPWPADHPAQMLARTNPRLGRLDPLVESSGTVAAQDWPEVVARAVRRIGTGAVEKVVLARDVAVRHRDGEVVRVAPVLERLQGWYGATWTFAVDGLL
ncbi:MAG TPA: isochorismate synthase, partial [Ornithinimicrobium sp.]|nr:isochorismate synthase [Ornithinimicrobium sp.]